MDALKYVGLFVIFYIVIYLVYYWFQVRPFITAARKKKKGKTVKKEKDIPPEIKFLKGYYKVDVDKIGLIRTLKILNIVNAFFLTILVMIVLPFKEAWLKIILLFVLIFPAIWFVYYFVAKYLKYLERKSDKNV
ncbi:MAG: hypothetical protein IKF36_02240 [Bacilli bacterium]|nr:hypothetical protein [Bacilli bacterium]